MYLSVVSVMEVGPGNSTACTSSGWWEGGDRLRKSEEGPGLGGKAEVAAGICWTKLSGSRGVADPYWECGDWYCVLGDGCLKTPLAVGVRLGLPGPRNSLVARE